MRAVPTRSTMATFAALTACPGRKLFAQGSQRMVEMLDKVASEAEVNQLVGALKAADSPRER